MRWFRPPAVEGLIRPLGPADLLAARTLADRADHAHVHADWWPLEHYLARAPGLVAADERGRLIGVLACPPDPPPGAWLRALAVANGRTGRDLAPRLLAAALGALAPAGVRELAAMHAEPWLTAVLQDQGFAAVTRVVTWRTRDLSAPGSGQPGLRVRPASLADIPVLAAAEATAFEPLWRLSAETLERMLVVATHFRVAELDGQPAGFQFSSFYPGQAHLVRITVHPDCQGLGLGTALLADLFAASRARGVRSMTLNTQQDNASAQRLYARFGFQLTEEATPVWWRRV